MNKKGFFYSMDALFALILLLLSAMIIYPHLSTSVQESSLQGDIIKVLSSLTPWLYKSTKEYPNKRSTLWLI